MLQSNSGVEPVALVRNPARLFLMANTASRDKEEEAEVRGLVLAADYCDRAALDAAFEQLDEPFRLYLACGNGPLQVAAELNLIAAASATGKCEYICKLSTCSAALEMAAGPYMAHLAVEATLAAGDIPHSILRPQMFMQMISSPVVGIGDQLTDDSTLIYHPFADKGIPLIAAEDVARVAATILQQPEMPVKPSADGLAPGETLELTGPTPVSYSDVTASLSKQRSVPLECRPRSFEEHAPAPPLAKFLEVLSTASTVTGEVERVTGKPATTLDEFLVQHPDLFDNAGGAS